MDKNKKESNINLNVETTPILFSDFVIWNISPDGIVLNFGQKIMGTNQIKIISRVGMSREFAKTFVKEFGKNLALTEAQGQTGKAKS